jgi:ketosteroid isomerase-like protein
MSNLEIVQRSYLSFSRGDLDAVLADLDPAIEWHQAQGLPHGGLYRGVDEVRRNIFEPLDAEWWSVREARAIRFRQFLDTAGWVEALA